MKKSLGAQPLLYPSPVLLVGTYDDEGKANMMNAAWGGICCSVPPCLSVSLRKATHSYAAIVRRKAFTIGIASQQQVAQADYCGIYSGRDVDKFAELGWTPVKSELVDAPYAAELPFVAECQLIHTLEIGLHTLFVGEIKDIKVDEQLVDDGGKTTIEQIQPLLFDPGMRHYHGIGELVGKAFSIGKKESSAD